MTIPDRYAKHVDWAMDNIPQLAMQGRDAARDVVKQAHAGIEYVEFLATAAIAGGAFFFGRQLMVWLFGPDLRGETRTIAALLLAVAFAYLTHKLVEIVVRWNIKRVAHRASEDLY